MPSRRAFLAGLAAASLPAPSWADLGHPAVLSAARTQDGTFRLVGLRANGALAFNIPLPARGHAAAAHPTLAEAVAIARRPGTFAKVIDCATGAIKTTLSAPNGRHFYGHGAFSSDGALLFTPENDIATGAGRVGVWSRVDGYERIDEFASGGIGPHEIIRLSSGDLAIANGGIRTHPDQGRAKLNLESMRANLSILSPDGALIERAELPREQRLNSIRHVAAGDSGKIYLGCQWQGDAFDAPPLVAVFQPGAGVRFLESDLVQVQRAKGYIGSVSKLGAGVATSSPRGGIVQVFGSTGDLLLTGNAPDICGLASIGSIGLATDGMGHVYHLSDTSLNRVASHRLAFDNHLVAL